MNTKIFVYGQQPRLKLCAVVALVGLALFVAIVMLAGCGPIHKTNITQYFTVTVNSNVGYQGNIIAIATIGTVTQTDVDVINPGGRKMFRYNKIPDFIEIICPVPGWDRVFYHKVDYHYDFAVSFP